MRVLAGTLKNRELKTPKGDKTRPTSAKVRGSLFDILQGEIQEATFLDLFAGSGAMGIEALSRGANSATFVEKERGAAKVLRSNLENLSLTEKSTLIQTDVTAALKRLKSKRDTFDIIYIDPPYSLPITTLLETISTLLTPSGVLIIEQRKGSEITPAHMTLTSKRAYGDTLLLFFSKRSSLD
ncbi:MAG: Ribosomal RNA small subunit methyltransferase D [Chlamydiae bacterium]|nr:Ribosomal RNA small subunit methyltransferase D [Chlamydiota bacterium]